MLVNSSFFVFVTEQYQEQISAKAVFSVESRSILSIEVCEIIA